MKAPARGGGLVGSRNSTLEVVQARESSDNPILNAFWRVAPSVRLSILAIFLAGVFFRASDFSSRTCAFDQACLLDGFFTM